MTKKALFISGGWDGHEPVETSEFISEQIKIYNIESKIVNDLDVMTDLEYLKSFDVILPVWTMGQIDDNNWEIIPRVRSQRTFAKLRMPGEGPYYNRAFSLWKAPTSKIIINGC